MESETAIIPTRSKRQAMDWSLVLLSQGIETTIQGADKDHGWQLIVAPVEHARALESIRQYQMENRAHAWRRYLRWSGLIFDWRSTLWFLLLILLFALNETRFPVLEVAGRMDNEAVWSGEWWRLLTAIMLHAGISHLIANVTAGVLLLGLAMGSFGPGFGLLGSYLAGGGGNLAGLFLYPMSHLGLGASGMVMGALGLLTAQSLTALRGGASARQVIVRAFMGGLLLLVLWGFNPTTDVIAHIGGFLTGILLGGLLALFPAKLIESKLANRAAALVFATLVIGTWLLALFGQH
jgi:membrane associated rhomboid family serine protease